jgi:hypothetical protein
MFRPAVDAPDWFSEKIGYSKEDKRAKARDGGVAPLP